MATMLDQVPTQPRPDRPPAETGTAMEQAARYKRAKARVEAIRGFFIHLAIYLTANAFLLTLNLVTTPDHLWFYWPLLGWGIGVAINAFVVFIVQSRWGERWEERKIREYMNQDQDQGR